jgi:hypothetical protein
VKFIGEAFHANWLPADYPASEAAAHVGGIPSKSEEVPLAKKSSPVTIVRASSTSSSHTRALTLHNSCSPLVATIPLCQVNCISVHGTLRHVEVVRAAREGPIFGKVGRSMKLRFGRKSSKISTQQTALHEAVSYAIEPLEGRQLLSASISGTVYHDLYGHLASGAQPNPIFVGRQVFLDTKGSGHLVAGDPVTVTDSAGRYTFAGLSAGMYTIRMVSQSTDWCRFPSESKHRTPANTRSN